MLTLSILFLTTFNVCGVCVYYQINQVFLKSVAQSRFQFTYYDRDNYNVG